MTTDQESGADKKAGKSLLHRPEQALLIVALYAFVQPRSHPVAGLPTTPRVGPRPPDRKVGPL